MEKKTKIRVRWAIYPEIDFGMLGESFKDNETNLISREFWVEYVDARMRFEALHSELKRKMKVKDRLKYRKIMAEFAAGLNNGTNYRY